MAETTWRNRITGHADVDPKTLAANSRNFRTHPDTQTSALLGAVNLIGFTRSVTVSQNGTIIDGHLRVALAIREHQATIPVEYVDLTPEEELTALLTTDPLAAMAGTDNERLASLLAEVQTDDKALTAMLAELAQSVEEAIAVELKPPEKGGTKNLNFDAANTQIRPVIIVHDIGTVEKALYATGETNRGRAFVEVCRSYLAVADAQR